MNKFKAMFLACIVMLLCTSFSFADTYFQRFNRESNGNAVYDMDGNGKNDLWINIQKGKSVTIKSSSGIILQKNGTSLEDFFECAVLDLDNKGKKELVLFTINPKDKKLNIKLYTSASDKLISKNQTIVNLSNDILSTSYIMDSDINKNGARELVLVFRDRKTNLINRWGIYEQSENKLVNRLNESLAGNNIIQIKVDDIGQIIKKKVSFNANDLSPKDYTNMYFTFADGKLALVKKDEPQKYYMDYDNGYIDYLFKKVALEEGVPYEVLKAIGYRESKCSQFDYGEPLIAFDNGIGIMQITLKDENQKISYMTGEEAAISKDRLLYDTEYNIRIGARILYEKWRMSFYNLIPAVSDMNPDIIENWYFSIMAYNGYTLDNVPKKQWGNAYQEQVIDFIENFNKPLFAFDRISAHGINQKGLPEIKLYELDGAVTESSNKSAEIKAGELMTVFMTCNLRSAPEISNDNVVGKLLKDTKVEVIEKAGYSNGYQWYKIKSIKDGTEGYAASIFLRYSFDDIAALSWGKKEITILENMGIVETEREKSFRPADSIKRGDFSRYIVRMLGVELKDYKGYFSDLKAEDPNALYLEAAYELGIVTGINKDGKLLCDSEGKITREQIAAIIMRVYRMKNSNSASTLNNDIAYLDAKSIGAWAIKDVADISSLGIMKGNQGKFSPKANTSRQEAASIINRVNEIISDKED